MKTVLAPEDFAKLGAHVGKLQGVLVGILERAMSEGYLPVPIPPSSPSSCTVHSRPQRTAVMAPRASELRRNGPMRPFCSSSVAWAPSSIRTSAPFSCLWRDRP